MFPKTIGAAIARADRIRAAFQGEIAPTTPTGRRMPIAKAPGRSDGMTWPSGAYAAPAAWRKRPGTNPIWNMPKPKLQPVSLASHSTTSSRRDSRTSAAFRNTA